MVSTGGQSACRTKAMALSPASETKRGASIFFLVLSIGKPLRLGHAALLCAGPGLGSKPTEDRWMKG